jgi:hypothetical protein
LGLHHGGRDPASGETDEDNFKPNYHSIMNYAWQFPNNKNMGFAASWKLDYSREAFPDLDETRLEENKGIMGHPGHFVGIYQWSGDKDNATLSRVVPENGPADFNNGSKIDMAPYGLDINGDNNQTTLHGREDWSQLAFYSRENFRDNWADALPSMVADETAIHSQTALPSEPTEQPSKELFGTDQMRPAIPAPDGFSPLGVTLYVHGPRVDCGVLNSHSATIRDGATHDEVVGANIVGYQIALHTSPSVEAVRQRETAHDWLMEQLSQLNDDEVQHALELILLGANGGNESA